MVTDALLFEQFKGDWLADPELEAQAKANTLDNFLIVFAKKFLSTVLTRMDANADIFKAINDDKGFADDLKANYGREVYTMLRSWAPREQRGGIGSPSRPGTFRPSCLTKDIDSCHA